VADILVTEDTTKYQGIALALDKSCKLLAILGGLTLVCMAIMSLWSIVGRSFFSSPLLGDYELVQMLSGMAVAMTLPYAQWIGGHVIVDFFTAKAPVKANALMDMIAALLMAVFSAVIAWRLVVGLIDLKSTMDASMMLNLPTWWSYVPMTISFVLLTATALFTAKTNLRKLLK
jgi:TRAP-type C4-dicarboxylate transport system permease small subunit